METLVKRSELFSYQNVHYYLFAKTGFTKGCTDRAKEMGNVKLVRCEDMVSRLKTNVDNFLSSSLTKEERSRSGELE